MDKENFDAMYTKWLNSTGEFRFKKKSDIEYNREQIIKIFEKYPELVEEVIIMLRDKKIDKLTGKM